MSTYAVGDIQGCFGSLQSLLEKVHFNLTKDTLWVAGDMVNRGPNSLQTLRFLKNLGDRAVTVLGNHDLHLLAAYYGQKKLGPKDTAKEILNAPDCDEIMLWLRHQPLMHYDAEKNIAMTHAGIPPIWSINKAQRYSAEVSTKLRSNKPKKFFKHMYGNQPDIWNKNLEDMERLRVITNYFTRMRFCSKQGRLEFDSKSDASTAPKGFEPWFEHKNKLKGTQVIFGHWAALMGETNNSQFIGLDTGCVWGGCLTLYCLDTQQYFQQSCHTQKLGIL